MVVCVAGTWGEREGPHDWWHPASVWCANLRNAGLELLDETEPYEWSTALAIDAGRDPTWRTAGLALKWYVGAHVGSAYDDDALRESIVLVAHSHGGQVAAFALAAGLRVKRLVTCGTPVRSDMAETWALAVPHIAQDWTHVYTDELVRPLDPEAQPYQLLGCLPEVTGNRRMALASRNLEIIPRTTHHGLMVGPLWNTQGLWAYVT